MVKSIMKSAGNRFPPKSGFLFRPELSNAYTHVESIIGKRVHKKQKRKSNLKRDTRFTTVSDGKR